VAKTLEELKKENAEAEAAELAKAQAKDTESDEVPAEGEENLDPESATGEEGETPDAQDIPLWMQTEEQTSNSDQVPVKTHVAMKHKLKARAKEAESEVEQLRAEIEKLKTGQVTAATPVATAPVKRPKLEDYDYDDEKYNVALDSWFDSKMNERLKGYQQESQESQQQRQQRDNLERLVNGHYDRAAKLVDEGFLTADEYHASDSLVRRRLDSIRPGQGDLVTDNILAVLGDGSEKVMVALSRNPSYMAELERELQADATGSRALVYLGTLKQQFNAVTNRVSKAPKPAKQLKGDQSTAPSGSKDKKAYEAAHKAGDRQKAFNIKRAAKLAGVNTKEW
jgi:hypothetical protein